MTCHFDPSTGDVYDHQSEKVGNLDGTGWEQSWEGDYPTEVLDILRDAMKGTEPSAYNRDLLADMASENVEQGVPE